MDDFTLLDTTGENSCSYIDNDDSETINGISLDSTQYESLHNQIISKIKLQKRDIFNLEVYFTTLEFMTSSIQ